MMLVSHRQNSCGDGLPSNCVVVNGMKSDFFLGIYMVQFSCLIADLIRDILACDRANLSHTLVTHLWHDNIDSVA